MHVDYGLNNENEAPPKIGGSLGFGDSGNRPLRVALIRKIGSGCYCTRGALENN